MFRRSVFSSLALLAGSCLFVLPGSSAQANVIATVGSGSDSVQVYFNWPDAFNARYTAQYSTTDHTIDGYDATQIAALADPNLTLDWSNFGSDDEPNYFLNDATYTGGHTSVGSFYSDATPDNYWHEWVNYGSGWEFGNGASVDTLSSGDAIGWVFGTDSTPVPEPVSLSMVVAAGGLLTRRRAR